MFTADTNIEIRIGSVSPEKEGGGKRQTERVGFVKLIRHRHHDPSRKREGNLVS